jgi:hypothetical protein
MTWIAELEETTGSKAAYSYWRKKLEKPGENGVLQWKTYRIELT